MAEGAVTVLICSYEKMMLMATSSRKSHSCLTWWLLNYVNFSVGAFYMMVVSVLIHGCTVCWAVLKHPGYLLFLNTTWHPHHCPMSTSLLAFLISLSSCLCPSPCLWDRVLLCSPWLAWNPMLTRLTWKVKYLPASALGLLGLKVCATVPDRILVLKKL